MFKYVSIDFPNTVLPPLTISSFSLFQKRYAHEIAVVQFKDWNTDFNVVQPGMPVHIKLTNNFDTRDFYGYVHHINLDRTPGTHFTEVTFIGGSFPMKKTRQAIYKDTTADQVISQIANAYNFASYVVPAARVYPQISQAGHSDWEFMVRLARQNGYSLRTQNTELYFQPIMQDYTNLRASAPSFIMNSHANPSGSTIYSFNPTISESMAYPDAQKAAVAIGGVDSINKTPMSITQQIKNPKTRVVHKFEFFDKFDTHTVANDSVVASHEAEAAENRNYFPYRASTEVFGNPTVRPDLPIYLDGVGQPYQGYWVVLEVEHKVVEKQRNVFQYTCVMQVGIDSLGTAATWTDTQTIVKPVTEPTRVIIPNVLQTNVQPKTVLNTTFKVISPSSTGSFGTVTNIPVSTSSAGSIGVLSSGTTSVGTADANIISNVNVRLDTPAMWQTATPVLSSVMDLPVRCTCVANRLASKIGAVPV